MADPDDRDDDVDLAELRDLMARTRPQDVEWEPPPAGLWERIEAAIDAPTPTSTPRPKVVPITSRRRAFVVSIAAAAAVVLGVLAIAAVVTRDRTGAQLVSSVELERLGATGAGRAELVDRNGQLQLRVNTSDLDPGEGFLELWLIDPTVTKLVSLGPLRPDGTYDLPRGVDPARFPIVDVSVEPIDGNPAHSGDSVLRGELPL